MAEKPKRLRLAANQYGKPVPSDELTLPEWTRHAVPLNQACPLKIKCHSLCFLMKPVLGFYIKTTGLQREVENHPPPVPLNSSKRQIILKKQLPAYTYLKVLS